MVGMESSAALLLVSQGLVSCEGAGRENGGNEFGLEKVRKVLQNAPSLSAKALCSSVLSSVADFSGHVPLCDDRTALALIRTPLGQLLYAPASNREGFQRFLGLITVRVAFVSPIWPEGVKYLSA